MGGTQAVPPPAGPGSGGATYPPQRRMRRPAEFQVAMTPDWRATSRHLAVQVKFDSAAAAASSMHTAMHTGPRAAPPAAAVRFGLTVGKRNARLAVARNLVKRVLREAGRARAAQLDSLLGARSLAVVFRLKAPLNPEGRAARLALKAGLRREADGLLLQLGAALKSGRLDTGRTGR